MFPKIKTLMQLCEKTKKINIAGAGVSAKKIIEIIKEIGYIDKVSCCVVSSKLNNPDNIHGIPVFEINDTQVEKNNVITLIAVINKVISRELFDGLMKNHYHMIHFIPVGIYTEYEELLYFKAVQNYFIQTSYVVLEENSLEKWHCNISLPSEKEGSKAFYKWRFNYLYDKKAIEEETLIKRDLKGRFEGTFGKYRLLSDELKDIKLPCHKEKNICIYIARCHVDQQICTTNLPSCVVPIQVGAALTEKRICDIVDNVGENISYLNKDYSECTAHYWIWKNVQDVDYVGVWHYRRHMAVSEEELQKLTESDIDIVLTTPLLLAEPIPQFFAPFLMAQTDWDMMEKYLILHFSEYKDTLEQYKKTQCFPAANICIMKKEVFHQYCKFCYTILLDITKEYAERGIIREDRYAGYLMENLTAIFAMKHQNKYKIAYTDFYFQQ